MSKRYTVARITQEGEHFEILVKPKLALSYKLGKITSVSETLVTDTIFTDANKGSKASEDSLRKVFGTEDTMKIAEAIIKRGTLQLTTEQRRQMVEDKRNRIITFISRQCVDPKTNLPHPSLRIERAMEQIHYSIDPFKDVEAQAREIIKLLRPILPLKMEQVSVTVRIPPEYSGKVYGTVKGFGTIKREEWQADGSWLAIVELPAGICGPFLEKIGEITRGNLEAKMVE